MIGVLLALMVVFEVGIRHVPPDGMTVSYTYYFNSATGIGPRIYSATRDRQTIAEYYAALNHAPVRSALNPHGCTLSEDPSSVEFTWHSIAVESWTQVGCTYVESAGGISNEMFLTYHDSPDITMPPPTPHVG